MERHFFGGGNFYGFWDDIFGSRTPSEFCVASGCLSSLLGLGASSVPFLGFWTSSQPVLGLGPLLGLFGLLGLFPAFSRPRGLFWAFSGLGPLLVFFGLLGLFAVFSGPGASSGFFEASGPLLGLFPAFSGPRACSGFWTSSQPFLAVFWARGFVGF